MRELTNSSYVTGTNTSDGLAPMTGRRPGNIARPGRSRGARACSVAQRGRRDGVLAEQVEQVGAVALGLVAPAVVHDDVRLGGLARQLGQLRRPGAQLLRGVVVVELLLDAAAGPLLAVPVEAHDGGVGGGCQYRRDRVLVPL